MAITSTDDVLLHFAGLVNNSELGDVTFELDEGPPIHGVKAVVASRNSHFHQLFFGTGAAMQEGSTNSVRIKECDREAFLGFLEILHTGRAKKAKLQTLIGVTQLLDYYGMPEEVEALQVQICNDAKPDLILELAELSQRSGLTTLRDLLVDKLVSNQMLACLDGKPPETASSAVWAAIAQCSMRLAARASLRFLSMDGYGMNGGVSVTNNILEGKNPGWNKAMFDVANPSKFSMRGVMLKGRQVDMWCCRIDTDCCLSNVLQSYQQSSLEAKMGAIISFSFDATQQPSLARIEIDGVEQRQEELPAGVYRPIIIIGDRDQIAEFSVD